jgi:hypothetical protein
MCMAQCATENTLLPVPIQDYMVNTVKVEVGRYSKNSSAFPIFSRGLVLVVAGAIVSRTKVAPACA